MTRNRQVLLVALLVSLAGCGALDQSPTRSAFDVNGTTPLIGIEFDAEHDRMPAPEDVYDAHLNSLNDTAYTLEYQRVTRLNGSIVRRERWDLAYAKNHDRYLQVIDVSARTGNETDAVYSNGSRVWRQETRDDRTTVTVATNGAGVPMSPEAMRADIPRSVLQGVLVDIQDPEVEETGLTRYRITTDNLSGPSEENKSVSVSMTVTEDGHISMLEYVVESHGPDGGHLVSTVTLRYRKVGATTVEEPDWVPSNASNETVIVDNGTATETTPSKVSNRVFGTGHSPASGFVHAGHREQRPPIGAVSASLRADMGGSKAAAVTTGSGRFRIAI